MSTPPTGGAAAAPTRLARTTLALLTLTLAAGPMSAQQAGAGVMTLMTTAADGAYARVDLVDGGLPRGDRGAETGDHPARRAFLEQLTGFTLDPLSGAAVSAGRDLDGDLADSDGDGIPDSGFDAYAVGLAPSDGTAAHRYIIGANNLYDLFQTTLGPADPAALDSPAFAGFSGGDADGDGDADGGPGLFSNGAGSLVPRLPVLPAVMGAGRGGEPGVQHQFVQLVFPYALDVSSLFDADNPANSFLADAVSFRAHAVRLGSDGGSVVDQFGVHVPCVAIVGGLTSLPAELGSALLATVDGASPALSGIPVGARQRVFEANVLTLIAHEDPASLVTAPDGHPGGFIDDDAILRLPAASDPGLAGGRVFGANTDVPDAVNDFATSGTLDAAAVGFVSLEIASLRTSDGESLSDPVFRSLSLSQALVGADPRAPAGGFDRGPALPVSSITGLPAIEPRGVLGEAGPGQPLVSTRARFVVRFDREVVPDSVGFSRRHTLQRTDERGVVLPFNGNTAPLPAPASQFVPGAQGVPVAPSLYLAVNQPAQVAVNNPFVKDADGDGLLDDGVTPIAAGLSAAEQAQLNGLHPALANPGASLPRGVVPCDIYPLNQDNLQAYVVEPLIELPAGATVTLGVCRQGLGTTALGLTNVGNFTVAGTVDSPLELLTPVGLGDPFADLATLGDPAVVKVNAGPMDLHGRLFTGSTDVVLDTLLDGDPANDQTTGGFNVSRTFAVGHDASRAAVNAPVSPEALYAGLAAGGAGVVDLNGRGLTTNVPGGGLLNPEIPFGAVVSRELPPAVTGLPDDDNWTPTGALANGDHQLAFGLLSRRATGALLPGGTTLESELAIAAAVPTGALTPVAGINEGSSGRDTVVRDSLGSQRLTGPDLGAVGDIALGQVLTTLLVDTANPFASGSLQRSFSQPGVSVGNNTVSDPPTPNPPPLTLPVGLPLTHVRFDQSDLAAPPLLIQGAEVFAADARVRFDDPGLVPAAELPTNGLVHLMTTADPGNPSPFDVPAAAVTPGPGQLFFQTGPLPRHSQSPAVLLSQVAQSGGMPISSGAVQAPVFQSRQQVGNLLFVTDRDADELVVFNSNTFQRLGWLPLPDPNGLGLDPRLELLYVSNTDDDSLSLVDADPRNATFLQELGRIAVGDGPTAVVVAPEGEDVFVCDTAGDTITIVDVASFSVRRTLDHPALDEPVDLCFGMREVPGYPGFESGTYHGFIANRGGDNVLVYQSGPSGEAGLGFDDITGVVETEGFAEFGPIMDPVAVAFDPVAPLDAFGNTIGCFVAHRDEDGQAVVSRVAYVADENPGPNVIDTTSVPPSLLGKLFIVTQRYESCVTGNALDLALADFDLDEVLGQQLSTLFPYTYNAWGAPPFGRTPVAETPSGMGFPRWTPGRLYLSVEGAGLSVFDVASAFPLGQVATDEDVTRLTSFFAQ